MRSFILLCIALFASSILMAGDNPCGATMLSTDNPDFILFNNSSNSESGIEAPPYGGYLGPDTWISFIMPNNGFYLIMNGTTMVDPAIAIYAGPCSTPKLLYNVLDNNCDGDPNPILFLDQLNPGQQYFIRVWAQDGSPNGAFQIKLIQSFSGIPDFLAFADATIVGDCIELTQNTFNQKGCAWYQNPIDFTMPFSHEMTANFGTFDANGADGICLVYQSVGQDFCGGTGEGIGASGMPNSAIFEFDTWQNGNLADPVQDHCAFNINGNMNHNNSIQGPVTLGNIEDGLDHTILFEWNPAGNVYMLYFDNVLVLNGSFDIVNNCFGGSTSAFWGYTSSTGGSTNKQVICPVVEYYEPSYTQYEEVDICQGESYLGHTDSGFYVDFIPGSNGCQYQLNTLIKVHELPEPQYLYEIVCEGEYILVGNDVFTLPDLYEINTYTEFGCDSTIFLQLDNVIPSIAVEAPPVLNCVESMVQLVPIPGSNFPINIVNYTWSSGASSTNQEILTVTNAGTYYLTALITSNGKQCLTNTSVTVEIDTLTPNLENLPDVYLDCTNIDTDTILSVSDLGFDVVPTWTFNDSIVGNNDTLNILGEGVYSIILTDTINGCTASDDFSVYLSNDIPSIQLQAESLNCANTSIIPNFTTTGDIDTIFWSFNNAFYSYDALPSISQAGVYMVHVISKDGCMSSAAISVEIDTLKPDIVIMDTIVACDIFAVDLIPTVNPELGLEWSGPNVYSDTSQIITVIEDGWYYLTATDPGNYCTNSDSAYVQFRGPSTALSLTNDTLNCNSPSALVELTADQTDLAYSWTHQSELFSENADILVSSDGWYFVEVTNPNGCNSRDSVYIHEDFTFPDALIYFDTINCINTLATITTEITNGEIIAWNGPDNFNTSETTFTTPSSGYYFLSSLNQNSGCTTMDTIEILNTSVIPMFEIFSDTLNCNTTNITLPFSLATPYLDLLWTGPGNFSDDALNPNVSIAGDYYLHVEFEGECFLDTSLHIAEDIEAPSFLIDYDSITCFSPLVTINATITDPSSEYLLTTPDGNITSMTTFSGTDSGFYYVYLEGMNGCISADTFYVSAHLDKPIVAISDLDSITCINPDVSITTITDDNDLIYQWTGPNNFTSDSENIVVEKEGTYSLAVLNAYGCTDELEIDIKAYLDSPQVALEGEDIFCDKLESTLHFSSPDNLNKVTWSGSASFHDFDDYIVVEEAGWYTIQVENEFGCTSNDSLWIAAYVESPELTLLTPDTLTVNVDDPNGQILLDVRSNVAYKVRWLSTTGLSCYDCLDPVINTIENTFYEVEVTNEYGCTASEVIFVRFQEMLKVYIPNVFAPGQNGGKNDFFTIYGNNNIAKVNKMLIYDRWGELVAMKENFPPNIPSEGWDGSISGKRGQTGVYVYMVQITTTDDEVFNYYGDVTLLY